MSVLRCINSPADLRRLDGSQLADLAAEIRGYLVESVARTGGHLGPNLGVVELTIALHRVFDSPRDRILWDTGHQAYVHKLLTGRQDFARLRKAGGLSGYPNRAESEHDVIENSHASTALSYADGLAKAFERRAETDRAVVAVVGDGALTGGMCWEALNNIGGAQRPVIIVLNDNGRSYSPTVGGLAAHLQSLRERPGLGDVVRLLRTSGAVSAPDAPAGAAHAHSEGGLFGDLGLSYVGPVDGHDVGAVEAALRRARAAGGPVVVHCMTAKGAGYQPALHDDVDRMHSVGVIDPATGVGTATSAPTWTDVFGTALERIGAERDDVVAVTAAMLHPTGLARFASRYPERTYDVGIAEQHAVASAAGLATGGLHPVVAIYATFLNRAFDQTLMDVGLHRLPVTFVLDRAGVTGSDGPSHNGMWDLSILQVVPGLRLAAPRDAATLRAELREAVEIDDGPTVVRFPKATVGADLPAVGRLGGVDILRRAADRKADGPGPALIVSVGAMAQCALATADRLAARGVDATVVDPRWVIPVDPALVALATRHRLVVTIEDNGRTGGVGAAVAQALRSSGVPTPVMDFGIPKTFLPHAGRAETLAACGLTPDDIAADVMGALAEHRPRNRRRVPRVPSRRIRLLPRRRGDRDRPRSRSRGARGVG